MKKNKELQNTSSYMAVYINGDQCDVNSMKRLTEKRENSIVCIFRSKRFALLGLCYVKFYKIKMIKFAIYETLLIRVSIQNWIEIDCFVLTSLFVGFFYNFNESY